MADQLYLSYWVRGFTPANMLRHFEKMIGAFPHSRLSVRETTMRVYAGENAEPAVAERSFLEPDAGKAVEFAREALNADCAFFYETAWDLWQKEGEWQLWPSPVTLVCFGPGFENETGDHLRIELGIDANFLPLPELGQTPAMMQANIRSLLHLTHHLDGLLGAERRRLWTESGENFAERLVRLLPDGTKPN